MPSFPNPGSVTICEINRDLITADNISDDRAKETYGKILGMVFSPLPFEYDQLVGDSEQQEIRNVDNVQPSKIDFITGFVKRIFQANGGNLLPGVSIQSVSWNQHKHIIAFVSGPNQVMVRDYEDSDVRDPCFLTSESQRDIKDVQWRPNGGKSLAVACKGGICIWAASYPGNAALVRTGAASFLGTLSRGSGTRWSLVDFLRSPNDEQISALSWSPDGRYLASASNESSSYTIWDVAQGLGTPIRRGFGGISLLRWSPTGDYFFAAKVDGTFYLWETNTWTSEQWSSTSGLVTGATWDPDGRVILIAFSGSLTLGSIHFASKPPLLDAHLLPVDLSELKSLTGSQGVEKIAWDASGERLALSYEGGDDNYKGLIAVFDTRRAPLISASLIGFIRGPGGDPKPVAFSFHDKFKQGPLLSVCWSSGYCCTYPLLFRS